MTYHSLVTSIARRKKLESVPGCQGGGGAGERQRSIVHSSVDLQCVSYAGSHQQRGVGIPFVTGLAPYLGVSPDRQLFVEFNVNEARK
ncbi:hypothetical protein OUZ56_018572 [Daphnia magna]|uniref:Uncharacterized protein n=1 Tax=Daphnia magna TaxID=35525 RepID=A0ABQ9Z9T8_9CRUS|nr:hypothetical protein OUZ56_018572 [Daphnia magna]